MKKTLVIATTLLALGSAGAYAQQGVNNNNNNNTTNNATNNTANTNQNHNNANSNAVNSHATGVTTVAQAKDMDDNASVMLRGNITQHNSGEKYTFRDASGEITVDIDNEKWNGTKVEPNETVEIRGEVDKGWTTTEIKVESVRKVN